MLLNTLLNLLINFVCIPHCFLKEEGSWFIVLPSLFSGDCVLDNSPGFPHSSIVIVFSRLVKELFELFKDSGVVLTDLHCKIVNPLKLFLSRLDVVN